MASPPAALVTINTKFSAQDADRIVQSSDFVKFHLHSKYLKVYAGAFPERNNRMREPAKILEILFEFVYPRRHPSLAEVDFATLKTLGETAEKYQVYNAMSMCEARMRSYIPSHPEKVLSYGVNYDYPQLVNEAALHLSRLQRPVDEVLEKLPGKCRWPWIRYTETWKSVFKEPHQMMLRPQNITCHSCRAILVMWLSELESTSSPDSLKEKKAFPQAYQAILLECKPCSEDDKNTRNASYGQELVNLVQSGAEAMPTFTEFMKVQTSGAALMMKVNFRIASLTLTLEKAKAALMVNRAAMKILNAVEAISKTTEESETTCHLDGADPV